MISQKEANQLNAAKAQVKALWILACQADGIDPESKFVVFTANNQVAQDHGQAISHFFDLRNRIKRNEARRERHAAYRDLGLTRVKGNLGGTYYE